MNDRISRLEADADWFKKLHEENRSDHKEMMGVMVQMQKDQAAMLEHQRKQPSPWVVIGTLLAIALATVAAIIGGISYLQP